jgi:hypothetical protein
MITDQLTETTVLIVAIVTAIALVLVCILIIIVLILLRRKRNTESNVHKEVNLAPAMTSLTRSGSVEFKSLSGVVITGKLGSGNFATVFKGDWMGTPVALKLLKDPSHFAEFTREASMLQYIFLHIEL